jgi:glycosyltransferase involved in cell wall biosynthesis
VEPIRVAHVIPDLAVGGAETALVRLLEGMDRERFAALVVTLRDRGAPGVLAQRAELAGARVVSLGMRGRLPSPITVARLRSALRSFAPDVVQGWMYHGNLAAWLGGRLLPYRPVVIWNIRQSLASLEHQRGLTRLVIRANALLSRQVALIVNNSEASARQHARSGFDAERVEVIPNGFNAERFRPSESSRAALRAELGVASEALLVGLIARLDPVKRHDLFLAAVAHAARRGLDVHVVLAGAGATAANPLLARLVSREGIGERTHLLGERHDVERLMPALDVLVSASGWAEGFPNVVGEAMSCGVPCLVTDTGDCAAIVGAGGVVVPPGDAGALSSALDALLRLSRAERRTIGEGGRKRVVSEFALSRCVDRYSAIYEGVARSPSRGAVGATVESPACAEDTARRRSGRNPSKAGSP